MIGILGRNYKFTYGARNFVSGLIITATVLKPDGTLLGNYHLTEFSFSSMKGIYFFDMVTTDSMPEGEYSVAVIEVNPALQDYKTHNKVTMRLSYGEQTKEEPEKIVGVISGSSIVGKIQNQKVISGVIQSKNIIGKMIFNSPLVGTIEGRIIIGVIKEQSLTGVIQCSK